MSKFLRLGHNFHINMNNVISIHHYPEKKIYELTTLGHYGDGFILVGSGGYDSYCLKYKIQAEEYESLKKYLDENLS